MIGKPANRVMCKNAWRRGRSEGPRARVALHARQHAAEREAARVLARPVSALVGRGLIERWPVTGIIYNNSIKWFHTGVTYTLMRTADGSDGTGGCDCLSSSRLEMVKRNYPFLRGICAYDPFLTVYLKMRAQGTRPRRMLGI